MAGMLTQSNTDPSTGSADFDRALAERLRQGGRLDAAGLSRGQRLAAETGERLNVVLSKLGLIADRAMAEVLAELMGDTVVQPAEYPSEPVLRDSVSLKFLKESRLLPLADTEQGLVLAMADPLDGYALDAMRLFVGKSVIRRIGVPSEIEAAFERLYGRGSSIDQIVDDGDADGGSTDTDIARLKDMASEAPVIRLVNHLINRAVELRASDIHFEPFQHAFRVRYRIDGVLQDVEAPPLRLRAAVISRIKIMAHLNIAETRLPQDGRVRLVVGGKPIDMRVATVPTMHGESAVLRLLDREAVALDFTALGFDDATVQPLIEILDRPHGILLVTGPTGSGKTTTLYASLTRLNNGERKILTVEDPVEYQLDGVNQVQVRPGIGLSFAHALRAFMRHDPDVIMIGEIRDLETAQIAVQSALTGHKVLSTVHTNDAASTITRLLDMGVEDYLLPSTLNGIVAQRLVRTLCQACKEPFEATPELLRQLRLGAASHDGAIVFHRATGCGACNGVGYRGRTTIAEVMPMTPELSRLVLQHTDGQELQRAALAAGMRSMYQDGILKVRAGITSLEEIVRVTREV
jgi:general secretion pathway protein E